MATKELSGKDNASLVISNSLSSQISTLTQSIQNSNDSIGMYQIADSSLSELSIGTDAMNDLSVRYNSDVLNASQKDMLKDAFAAVSESMQTTISQSTYNGQNVLSSALGLEVSGLDSLSIDNQQGIADFQGSLTSLSSVVSSNIKSAEVSITNSLSAVSNLTSANAQISETPMDQKMMDLAQNQIKLDSSIMAQVHQTSLMQQKISTLLA
jgi:flagellin